MKVLYFIGMPIPKVSEYIGVKKNYFGGWLTTTIEALSIHPDIDLTVLSPYKGKVIKTFEVEDVKYYFIPMKSFKDIDKKLLEMSINEINPDISHMEGTEFKYHKTFMKVCDSLKVVSLQGILNSYFPHINGGLITSKLLFSLVPSKFLLGISLIMRKIKFKYRMSIEKSILKSADNFLGRTIWDKSHSRFYNSSATYYEAPRILRPPFYSSVWNIDNIERHTIYIGNADKPLKGAHILFEALKALKNDYPEIKVYVAGKNPYSRNILKNAFKNAYSNYLVQFIKKNKLQENIVFLGELSEIQVSEYLLRSNVYCLCSSIENSPNSLAEAMAIGTPSISSYVGGVSSMANDNEDVLFYRFGDIPVLTELIRKVFDNDDLALNLSKKSRAKALSNHSKEQVIENLYACYLDIITKGK